MPGRALPEGTREGPRHCEEEDCACGKTHVGVIPPPYDEVSRPDSANDSSCCSPSIADPLDDDAVDSFFLALTLLQAASGPRENYILKIVLCQGRIKNPAVTRTLSCPATATFRDFHRAIQIAFGWSDKFDHDFAVRNPRYVEYGQYEAKKILREKAMNELGSVYPELLWTDGDMNNTSPSRFALRIVNRRGRDDIEVKDDSLTGHTLRNDYRVCEIRHDYAKLCDVFEENPGGYGGCPLSISGAKLEYLYSFADEWVHDITVVDRAEHDPKFRCLHGSGHEAAENLCEPWQGPLGYERLKTAYARGSCPTCEACKGLKDCYKNHSPNYDRLGLTGDRVKKWSRDTINIHLAQAGL